MNRKHELWMMVPIAIMFLYVLLAWRWAPQRCPVHWNLAGEVDRYGSRFAGMLLTPLLALGVYAGLLVLPLIDPGKANYQSFGRVFFWIRLLVVWLIIAIYAGTQLVIFGISADLGPIAGVGIGVLFLFLGNVLGKIRPNWFVGIRTPWTLSSQLSWNRTHRLGGWLFFLQGPLFIALGIFASKQVLGAILVMAIVSAVVLAVYSFLVWRTDPDRISPAGTAPAPHDEADS